MRGIYHDFFPQPPLFFLTTYFLVRGEYIIMRAVFLHLESRGEVGEGGPGIKWNALVLVISIQPLNTIINTHFCVAYYYYCITIM